jgi:hypothetical protein
MTLPSPVTNAREAFCTRGCHGSFYRSRCRVCEASFERKNERQKVCKKSKCRNAFRAGSALGRYHASSDVISPPKNVDSIDSKQPIKPGRGWRIVAGPKLSPESLRFATTPDGSDSKWEGGSWRRLEAQSKAALEAHFDSHEAEAVANDFCTVCGREDDLGVTHCRGCLLPKTLAKHSLPIPDDLTIPDWLRR